MISPFHACHTIDKGLMPSLCSVVQERLTSTGAQLDGERKAHEGTRGDLEAVRGDMAAAEAAAEEVTERLNADIGRLEV